MSNYYERLRRSLAALIMRIPMQRNMPLKRRIGGAAGRGTGNLPYSII